MKVAVITESFPKLSETFVISHIIGLIDSGVEVYIFAFNHLTEGKIHPIVLDYKLLDISTYSPGLITGKFQRLIKGTGIAIKYIVKYPKVVLRALNFFKFGKEALNLQRLFEVSTFFTKVQFDIIHCHFGTTAEKIAEYQKWGLMQAPLVTSFHGFDVDDPAIRVANRYDYLKERGALYISNSNYTKKRIVELGFDENKIQVLPVYFDTAFFTKKNLYPGTVFHLLTVGRLVEFKGIEFSIRAMALVIRKIQVPFHYSIVGAGPLREHLQSLIHELNMNNYIELLGNKTQDEILELMDSSDVFLLTGVSSTDGRVENQGLVIQEAQAMELPVIVSDVGGIAEGMINNKTGFLVEQKDIESIAEKIIYLYLNPSERIRMGKAGRAFVQDKYSIPFSTKQLMTYYKNLIKHG
jgi:colanic acid/amylovoran biosynthesis glycosyltransferase